MHFWVSATSCFERNPLKTCDAIRPHVSATHVSCPVRQDQHCEFVCDQPLTLNNTDWRQKEKWGFGHMSCLATQCLWANHNHPVLDFAEVLLSLMRKKRLSSSSVCVGPHAASVLTSRLTAQTASCSTAENAAKVSCGKAGSPQEPSPGPPCSLPVARQPAQSPLTGPHSLAWDCDPPITLGTHCPGAAALVGAV